MRNLQALSFCSIGKGVRSMQQVVQVDLTGLGSKQPHDVQLGKYFLRQKILRNARFFCSSCKVAATMENAQKGPSLEGAQQKQSGARVKVLWRKKKKGMEGEGVETAGSEENEAAPQRERAVQVQGKSTTGYRRLEEAPAAVQNGANAGRSNGGVRTNRNATNWSAGSSQLKSKGNGSNAPGQERGGGGRAESQKLELLLNAPSDEQAKAWLQKVENLTDQLLARRVFHSLVGKSFWQSAHELFQRMQQQRWWSNDWPAIYIQLITCLSRARQPQLAEDVVQSIQEQGCHVSMSVLNALLKAYVDGGWLEKARSLVKTLQESEDFPPTTVTYNIMLKGLIDEGSVDEAYRLLEFVEGRRMADAVTYNLFIHMYSLRKDECEAMEASFERMKQAGATPEAATYNTLVQGYVKAGRLEEAIRMIDAKHKAGLERQTRPLNMIMKALVDEGKLSAAELLYEEMLRQECGTDEVTHNILMHAYGKVGDIGKMEEMFERLLKTNQTPSLVTFNVLLDAYLKVKDNTKAMNLFQQILEWGLTPNSFSYNSVFKALGRAGDVATAERLFKQMEDSGCPANQVNYNTMLNIYAKCGDIEKMEALYMRMLETGLTADIITFTTRMNGYRLKANWGAVEKLYLEMQGEPHFLKPTFATLATLARAYASSGQQEKRDAVNEQLKALGHVKETGGRWTPRGHDDQGE